MFTESVLILCKSGGMRISLLKLRLSLSKQPENSQFCAVRTSSCVPSLWWSVGHCRGTFCLCCAPSEPAVTTLQTRGGDEFDWCQILFLHRAFHSNTHKWLQCHWNRTTLVADSGNWKHVVQTSEGNKTLAKIMLSKLHFLWKLLWELSSAFQVLSIYVVSTT